jgi:sulfatase maturation enzyme AslB (radical SAM superfamily)
VDCQVTVPSGQTVYVGTCGVGGASCYGDTALSLLSYAGQTLAANDDGASSGCGQCSFVNYTNMGAVGATYVLRQQCKTLKSSTCGGTSAFVFQNPQ